MRSGAMVHRGAIVLSDFDPGLGKMISWRPKRNVARIYLFEKRAVVPRNTECIFFRGSGSVVGAFQRGRYLHAKVRRYELNGREPNARTGFLVTVSWYMTHSTAYQGYHTGGETHVELYAIVIGASLVYRQSVDYPEVFSLLPETAGSIVPGLCTLRS
jgi:hypothetical protein